MRNKIFLLTAILLFFSACTEQDYRHMYDDRYIIINGSPRTAAESDYESLQNGQNPMKRPSYDEYREK